MDAVNEENIQNYFDQLKEVFNEGTTLKQYTSHNQLFCEFGDCSIRVSECKSLCILLLYRIIQDCF